MKTKWNILILFFSIGFLTAADNTNQKYGRPPCVPTTVDQTILPVAVPKASPALHPYEISKFSQFGYGVWKYGAGLPYIQRIDLLPAGYAPAASAPRARLLKFFTLSDVHVMDEETPAQAIYFGITANNASAYSPTMLYTTQVLNAAVGTINELHRRNPFDFGLSLGDNTNSNQYNEARWFIDILDGKMINPDSGDKDDPLAGEENDYQDVFRAEGLDRSIPWFQVPGNHDVLWLGSHPVNDYIRRHLVGWFVMDMGDLFTDPLGIESRGFYGGAIDGTTLYGDIIGAGPVGDFPSPPRVAAADYDRRAMTRNEWRELFFDTSTKPVGHGFDLESEIPGCYTFEPKAGIPIRVIVLDDIQPEDDFEIHEHGYLDQERFDWLVRQLDKGQAENKLMTIASHIPLPLIGYGRHSPITAATVVGKLHTYPNLLLWVAGHIHRNKVIAFPSPDPAKPELGFWHVETSSLRDFPQQFRTFELFRNGDHTISILVTNVDPVMNDNSFAAISRSYAIATMQTMQLSMENPSYNAELIKPLSAPMQLMLRNCGTPVKPVYRPYVPCFRFAGSAAESHP